MRVRGKAMGRRDERKEDENESTYFYRGRGFQDFDRKEK